MDTVVAITGGRLVATHYGSYDTDISPAAGICAAEGCC